MGHIIAIANQKGGTGKTTTTLNLGAALVQFHHRKVLLIDLDPQGSMTVFAGQSPEHLTHTVGDVIQQPAHFDNALQTWHSPELHLLPSCPSLVKRLSAKDMQKTWPSHLAKMLRRASKQYDFVLIDCPPTLNRLSQQTLAYANAVLIPLQCEYMALRGLKLLLNTIEQIRTQANPKLKVLGILPTMFDKRILHAHEVLGQLNKTFEGKLTVFSPPIHRTVRFAESAVASLPIFAYDPKNPGAIAYKHLAKEVAAHG